jgi:hypothetical protein
MRKSKLVGIFGLHKDAIRYIRDHPIGIDKIAHHKDLMKIWPKISIEQSAAVYSSKIRPLWYNVVENHGIKPIKVLEYQKRQHDKDVGTTRQQNWIRIDDYLDYLEECDELQYNLAQKSIRFPKDFFATHARTSAIINARLEEQRKIQAAAKRVENKIAAAREKRLNEHQDEMLREVGRKFSKRDDPYISGGLLIRPLQSVDEYINEGKINNNCVATYWKGVAIRMRTCLFAIRKLADPDTPYFTLELSKDGNVLQNRGKFNCNSTPEIDAFVKKWLCDVISKPERKKPRTKVKIEQPATVAI